MFSKFKNSFIFKDIILFLEIFCLAIIFPGKAKADIVPLEPKTFLLISFLSLMATFVIDFIINGLILVIGYTILKKIKSVKFWKFLFYIFLVTLGGAIIDLILIFGYSLIPIFLTTIGLFFYNFWLSRKFYNLTPKQSIFIGSLVGIFTNPAIYINLISNWI